MQGGAAGDGVQKGCPDRSLPNPSRLWAALLFNPAWLYRPGSPLLLQEGEFATFCLFSISSTFHNSIRCSVATGFGSFAFLYMSKSPDFSSAVHLEMLRWALLVAHQGDWAEMNPLVQKGYRSRVKGKRSLVSIDQPLPPAFPLAVASEAEGDFFLFPNRDLGCRI